MLVPKLVVSLDPLPVVLWTQANTTNKDTDTSLEHLSHICPLPASPHKRAREFLPWEDSDMVSGCDWVSQLTSQLRINLPPEEVDEDYTADAARAIMWKVGIQRLSLDIFI